MAYGTRYQSSFTSKNGFTYRVSLKEDGYASSASAPTFSGTTHSVIEWYTGGNDFGPFVPAEATVRLIDPSYSIASNIYSAGDRGYQLVIEEDQGSGYSDYFYGYVDPGQLERSLNNGNANTSIIRAIDGLGDLQDITFESMYGNDDGDDAGLSGAESWVSLVTRILDQIGFQIPLYVAMEWKYYKSSGSQFTSTDQALESVSVDIEKWAPEGEGKSYYLDVVLRDLLKNFHLDIRQARGAWHAYQHELYDNDSVPFARYEYVYNFYSAGTAATRDTLNPAATISGTDAPILRRNGGRAIKRRPLETAQVVFNHGSLSDLIVDNAAEGFEAPYTSGVASGWSSVGSGSATFSQAPAITEGAAAQKITSLTNTQAVPTNPSTAFANHATDAVTYTGISVPGGSGNKIRFSVDVFSNSGATTNRRRHIFIEFKVGSQWLQSDGTWSGSQSVLSFLPRPQAVTTIGASASDEIPSSGVVNIKIWNPVEAHSETVESGAAAIFDNLKIDYLPGGDVEDEQTITVAASGVSTAFDQETAIETELGDGPTGASLSSFLESSGVPTSNWGRGVQASASGDSLHKVLADSRVRLRWSARDVHIATYRFESSTIDPIEATDSPVIDSTRYGAPQRLLRDLHQAEAEFEAVEVEFNGSATTQSEYSPPAGTRSGGSGDGARSDAGLAVRAASNIEFYPDSTNQDYLLKWRAKDGEATISLDFGTGEQYTINAGSEDLRTYDTGGGSRQRVYIYFAPEADDSELQFTADFSDLLDGDDEKVYIGYALRSTDSDEYLTVESQYGGSVMSVDVLYADIVSSIFTKTGSLQVTDTLDVLSSGVIKSGASGYDSGTGYWLEYNAGTPRVFIGDSSANKILWDGSSLEILAEGGSMSVDADGITTTATGRETNIKGGVITTHQIFLTEIAGTILSGQSDLIRHDGALKYSGNVVWHQGIIGSRINALTADGSPDGANDYVATYDASSGAAKKVLLDDLPAGAGASQLDDLSDVSIGTPATREVIRYNGSSWVDAALEAADIQSGTFANARISESSVTQHEGAISHDSLSGFVSNEHVSHTSVSITAGTNLSGGGDISSSRTINLEDDILVDSVELTEFGDPFLGQTAHLKNHNGAIKWGAATMWTSGNDGPGSGLDADTLDGSEGSAYAKLADNETVSGAWSIDNKLTFTASSGIDIEFTPNSNFNIRHSGTGDFIFRADDGDVVYEPNGSNIGTFKIIAGTAGITEWIEASALLNSPPTGSWWLYFKSGGLYMKDDAGNETQVA